MSNTGDADRTQGAKDATIAVHKSDEANETQAVALPIFQSSTFRFTSAAHGEQLSAETAPSHIYTRWGNPTTRGAELTIAALEGAESCLVFSSGMAAGSTAVLSLVKSGDHIVAASGLYAGMIELFERVLPPLGITTTFVDTHDPDSFEMAITDNTKLLYAETPANPTLALTDLSTVGALGKSKGIFTLADNTWASPINQKPIECGIDAVVHSASKYLAGHSDVVAGALCGSRKWMESVWHYQKILGGCISPHDAFLLVRGLKTISVRVEQQNRTTLALASFLEDHRAVEAIHYPGLPSHPQHELACRQMAGFGGMLAFEVKGGMAAGKKLLESLKIAIHAVSLGGVETLAVHPASTTHGPLTPEERARGGITDGLIRVSVGLEAEEDLLEDFSQSLETVA